jgi:hypothetical protein
VTVIPERRSDSDFLCDFAAARQAAALGKARPREDAAPT